MERGHTSLPTQAPPPPIPAPAQPRSQPSAPEGRTPNGRLRLLPLSSSRPPSPGSLPPSRFLRAASHACRSGERSLPLAARRTHVVARGALARVTLTRLSPPTSRTISILIKPGPARLWPESRCLREGEDARTGASARAAAAGRAAGAHRHAHAHTHGHTLQGRTPARTHAEAARLPAWLPSCLLRA